MIQLNPLTPGPLRYVKYYEVHVAGSEANILIGLTKLGFKTGLITRVGNDEFGKLIINFLRGEGVDTSRVKIDKEAPTGVYFIQRHYPVPGKSTVFYYRHDSAASRLNPDDVDEDYVKNSKVVIITGITPALSSSCLAAVERIYGLAVKNNVDLVLDTNIRLKLWRKAERAREVISKFLRAKVVFTNVEDLNILFPGLSTNDAARKLLDRGAELVVVKLGEGGAIALSKDSKVFKSEAFRIPFVEDVIGAGDAFDAAFLASIYRGLSIDEALMYANAAGALVVTVRGDVEAQPSWDELKTFIESRKKALMLR